MANDTARIKANISKMIDQGAPESDIDAYVASEGTSPERLRGSVKDEGSYGNAVLHGASGVVSGIGKTIKDYISPEMGKAVEATGDSIAPTNYKPATEEFKDTFNPTLIPRGLTEALPGLSTDVIAGLAGKALLGRFGAIAGPAASYMARTAGSNAEARAANNGNAEPSATDKAAGLLTSGAGAAVNQIGVGRFVNPAQVAGTGLKGAAQSAGNLLKAGAATGASGVGSDAVDQVGQSLGTDEGLKFDPRQALASGVMSTFAGAVHATPRAIKDVGGAVRMRDVNEHPEAASAVANRMLQKTGGDTDALGNPKEAFRALRDTQIDVIGELRAVTAKKDLRGLSASPEAINAIKRAKDGNTLTSDDIDAVQTLGNPQILDLVKQANALTKIKDMGAFNTGRERFAGGWAETIREKAVQHPWGVLSTTGGFGVLNGLASAGATAGAAAAAIPTAAAMLGGGFAAYKVLQKIEKGFGKGAPVRTFAEKFANPNTPVRQGAPMEPPVAPRATPQEAPMPPQAEAPMASPAPRALPAPLDPVQAMMAQRKAQRSQSAPAEEAAATSRFDEYPEAPWALENSKEAARMALDHSIANGGTIHHKDGYMRGVARRIEGTEQAFDTLAKKITGPDQSVVEEALAKIKFVRSPEQAKEFRQAFKEKLPAHQEVIDKTLNDDWIKSVWTAPKKK